MKFGNLVVAAAAASLLASSAFAAGSAPVRASTTGLTTVSKAALGSGARKGADLKGANKLNGGSTVLAVLAAVAVAAGIYVAVDGGDSSASD